MRRYTDHKWFAIATDGRKIEIPEALYDAFSQFLIGRRGRRRFGRVILEYSEGEIIRLEYQVFKVFGAPRPPQKADDTSEISDLVPWRDEEES